MASGESQGINAHKAEEFRPSGVNRLSSFLDRAFKLERTHSLPKLKTEAKKAISSLPFSRRSSQVDSTPLTSQQFHQHQKQSHQQYFEPTVLFKSKHLNHLESTPLSNSAPIKPSAPNLLLADQPANSTVTIHPPKSEDYYTDDYTELMLPFGTGPTNMQSQPFGVYQPKNLPRFDGTQSAEFWVDEYELRTIDYTDQQRLTRVKDQLEDEAARWYANAYALLPFTTWKQFRERFLKQFGKIYFSHHLNQRLHGLVQKQGQSVRRFVQEVGTLLRLRDSAIDEAELFKIVKAGLLPTLARVACERRLKTVEDLISLDGRIEFDNYIDRRPEIESGQFDMNQLSNVMSTMMDKFTERVTTELQKLQTQSAPVALVQGGKFYCNYCGRDGHDEANCRTKRFHMMNSNQPSSRPRYVDHPSFYDRPRPEASAYAYNDYPPHHYQPRRDWDIPARYEPNYLSQPRYDHHPVAENDRFASRAYAPSNSNQPLAVRSRTPERHHSDYSDRRAVDGPRAPMPPQSGPPMVPTARPISPYSTRIYNAQRPSQSQPTSSAPYQQMAMEAGKSTIRTQVECGKIKNLIAYVDPGAECSLVNEAFVHKLELNIRPYSGPPLQGVDASKLQVLGQVSTDIKMNIGGEEVHLDFTPTVIAHVPSGTDLLLGLDLLSQTPYLVSLAKRSLTTPKEVLHLAEKVEVPANSTRYVRCVTGPRPGHQKGDYLAESHTGKYDVQPTLITVRNGHATIAVTNFSSTAFNTEIGQPIATIESVENSAPLHSLPTSTEQSTPAGDTEIEPELALAISQIQVGPDLAPTQVNALHSLLRKYRYCFRPDILGKCSLFQHRIVTNNHQPIATPPYRQSQDRRQVTNRLVSDYLNQGIIQASHSPWASPVVLVTKKNGDTRFCVDYRKLNAVTERDVYPLPRIDDSLAALDGSGYFTCLDLKSGYHQIEINEDDRPKTAFVTCDGLFEWRVMPFGLTNAPATFQRTMDVVLSGLKFNTCLVYLDDILIFSKTFDDHLLRLGKVLRRLSDANLTLNLAKSKFCLPQITYLGHVVGQDGLQPDPDKIAAVREFPVPKDVTGVRSFLGLCSYYRRFIDKFANRATALTRLLKKDQPFKWTEEQEQAFSALKKALMAEPILDHYKPGSPLRIHTDASLVGLGAVLLQENDAHEWKPLAFASRQTSEGEKNYGISDLEGAAVIFAVDKFRPYLEGNHIDIVTDHHSLCFLKSKNVLPRRLIRWALILQEFDYSITYRSGSCNKDADALSRCPIDRVTPDSESVEFKLDRAVVAPVLSIEDNPALSSYELPRLRVAQEEDAQLNTLRNNLTNLAEMSPKLRKRFARFALLNGVIHRKTYANGSEHWAVYLPSAMRMDICRLFHSDPTSGHRGIEKTYNKLRSKFYFRNMIKYITQYILNCEVCRHCSRRLEPVPPLRAIQVRKPFEIIGIDIVGPLPTSNRRKYIIVAVDYLTKYVETRALASFNTQQTTAFFTEQILLRHGAPLQLISDRGRNFVSALFQRWLKMSGINPTPSTAYHPQTNGLCERVNGIIVNILQRHIDRSQEDWSQWLPWATFAYNTTPHRSTSFSPFELVHGRPARLPLEPHVEIATLDTSATDYYNTFFRSWEFMREIARANIARAQDDYSFYHDLNADPPNFQLGDRVKIAREQPPTDGRTKKLEPTYDCGYTIIGLNDQYATVTDQQGHTDTVTLRRLLKDHFNHETLTTLDAEVTDVTPDSSDTDPVVIALPDRTDLEPPAVSATPRHVTFQLENDSTPLVPGTRDRSRTLEPVPNQPPTILSDLPRRRGRPRRSTSPPPITSSASPTPINRTVSPISDSPSDSDEDPNLDLPLLRRSARLRQHPRQINCLTKSPIAMNQLLAIVLCLNLVAPSFSSLLSAREPLTWSRTDKFVIHDTVDIDFNIYLASPCDVLDRLTPTKDMKVRCNQLFDSSFIQPLSKFCTQVNSLILPFELEKSSLRAKREILTVASIVISIVGLGTSAYLHWDTRNRIIYLEKREQLITEALRNFEFRLRQQDAALQVLDEKTQELVSFMTLLTSNLFWVRQVTEQTGRRWQTGKSIHPELLEVLNITQVCDPPCPPGHMWPKNCRFDPKSQILQLGLTAVRPMPNITVYEALPFDLYQSTAEGYCRFEYHGPPLTTFDNSTRKTCLIKEQQLTSAFVECLTANPQQFFTKQECYKQLFPAQVVQIHRSPHSVMVFCYPFNITVHEQTSNCPAHVIEVPANIEFNVAGHQYSHGTLRFSGRPQFAPDWTFRINHELINKGEKLAFYEPSPSLWSDIPIWRLTIITIAVTIILVIILHRMKSSPPNLKVTQHVDFSPLANPTLLEHVNPEPTELPMTKIRSLRPKPSRTQGNTWC